MGNIMGPDAVDHAKRYFDGQITCPADLAPPFRQYDFFDVQAYLNAYASGCP